jgi:DNA end-binding protein Ku
LELRNPSEFDLPSAKPKDYKISDKAIKMAEKLVDSMTPKWKPEKYHDEYREKLLKWIERKAKKGKAAQPPETEKEETDVEDEDVISMMSLLKESVEKQTKSKGKKTRSTGKKASKGRKKSTAKSE